MPAANPSLNSGLFEGKSGPNGADFGVGIGVIKVVNTGRTIKKYGLFDHPQAENLGVKINVFLGGPHTNRKVVQAIDVGAREHC